MVNSTSQQPNAIDGSFRDPHSAVFTVENKVYRGLSERASKIFSALQATQFFAEAIEDGQLIGTRPAQISSETAPNPRGQEWTSVVEHDRLELITYPYEWSFTMLQDAALCHLKLLRSGLKEGWTTSDGSAYNLQFVGANPIFIDTGSLVPARGPWAGYSQFCRTMLFPLLMQAHLKIPAHQLLRSSLEGIEPTHASASLRGLATFRRGVFTNVKLQAFAERRSKGASSEAAKERLTKAGMSTNASAALVNRLIKTVSKLKVKRSGSTWSDYRSTCSYDEADDIAKVEFVRKHLDGVRSGLCVDFGANDGKYSRIASEHFDTVLACDIDEEVIDAFYLELRRQQRHDRLNDVETGYGRILPLVYNIADPSPGLGWRNKERTPLQDRIKPDRVLALALLHHLIVGANLPIPQVVDWLRSFNAPVITEFVHGRDPMLKRLLANKPKGTFSDYSKESFEQFLNQRFEVLDTEVLPGASRTLYSLQPK